jgi:hypothetical protein
MCSFFPDLYFPPLHALTPNFLLLFHEEGMLSPLGYTISRRGRRNHQRSPLEQLHGIWRHPHETLLIARKPPQPSSLQQHHPPYPSITQEQPQPHLIRRVIAAVPDLHSRKPCLKLLIEEAFGFRDGEYRALEVFARSLVAGWWGWGDECLRFQWEGWWDEEGDGSD